jgi:hypothetical protein
MNTILAGGAVGRKNIAFGIGLFVILGVVVGIPLTVNFLGGSMLTGDQYQTWKVVHAYGVFLSFINFFFGLCVDRLELTSWHKEMSSWSFLLAGLIGGVVRMLLALFSVLGEFGVYASLAETALFVLGTFILFRGLITTRPGRLGERTADSRYSHAK